MRPFPTTAVASALVVALVMGCHKPELEPVDAISIATAGGDAMIPSVGTLRVNADSAFALIERHGSSWIIEQGFCFGTTSDVQLDANNWVAADLDPSGMGTFGALLPDMARAPGMFVRAFATNAEGTGYGEALQVYGVRTLSAVAQSDTSAIVTGTVNGEEAGVRGVCYSIGFEHVPSIDSNRVVSTLGSGGGDFSVTLTDLAPGQSYTVRAYAYLNLELKYGDTLHLTTRLCPTTVRDASGNVYNVVEMNGTCWMKENLKTDKYADGTVISSQPVPQSWNSDTAGAKSAPDGNISNVENYGFLYNHHAVRNTRGICPTHWEVPDNGLWATLATNPGDYFSSSPPPMAGYRNPLGQHQAFNTTAWFWTATDSMAYRIQDLQVNAVDTMPLGYGLSVRCIKTQE